MDCQCGRTMNVLLRTVVHARHLSIHNVPVYSCIACNHNEVHPVIKQHIADIIKQYRVHPNKQDIYFQDLNEFAKLLYRVSSGDFNERSIEQMITLRINELLDLLLLAESIHDEHWVTEIHDRLDQISDYSRSMHEWND